MIDEVGNPQDGGPNEALQILRSKDFKERLKRVSAQPKPAAPSDALERLRTGDIPKPAEAPAPEAPPFSQAPPQQAAAGGASSITPPTTPPAPTPQPAPAGGPDWSKYQGPNTSLPQELKPVVTDGVDDMGDTFLTADTKKNAEAVLFTYRNDFSPQAVRDKAKAKETLEGIEAADAYAKEEMMRVKKEILPQRVNTLRGMEQGFAEDKRAFEEAVAALQAKVPQYQQAVAQDPAQAEAINAQYQQELQGIRSMEDMLKKQASVGDAYAKSVEADRILAEGYDYLLRSRQGTFGGATWNNLLASFDNANASYLRKLIPAIVRMVPEEALGGMTADEASKELKSSLVPDVGTALGDVAGDKGTTKEYVEKMQETFLGGAWLGGTGSLPLALYGPGGIGMMLSASEGVRKQMDDPSFADIPDWKKDVFSDGVGFVIGQLERLGIKEAFGGGTVARRVLTNALDKLPRNATNAQFKAILAAETESAAANFAARIAGSAVSEYGVEAGQAVAEATMMDIFNKAEEKNLLAREDGSKGFDTPASFGELMADANRQGLQGMFFSGVVIGTPSAVYKHMQDRSVGKTTNDAQFELTESLLKDKEFLPTMEADLEAKVEAGTITPTQAEETKAAWKEAQTVIAKIPDDLPTDKKREAFDLLTEKQQLSKLDKSMVGDRIMKVDEKLAKVAGVPDVKAETKEWSGKEVEPKTGAELAMQQGPTIGRADALLEVQEEPSVFEVLNTRGRFVTGGSVIAGTISRHPVERQMVILTEDNGTMHDVGSLPEIGGKPIGDVGLEIEDTAGEFMMNEAGVINIGGVSYIAPDGLSHVSRDQDGNIESVTLPRITSGGRMRKGSITLTGNRAEEVAYELTLKHIRDNANTRQIEEAIDAARKAVDDSRVAKPSRSTSGQGAKQAAVQAPPASQPVTTQEIQPEDEGQAEGVSGGAMAQPRIGVEDSPGRDGGTAELAVEEPATGRAPVVEAGAAEQPAATPEEQPAKAVKAPKPKAPKKATAKQAAPKVEEPPAPEVAPKVAEAAKPRAGDRLRSMKIDTSKLEGLTFSSPIPIPPKKIAEAINGAIEVAATILDAYGSAADAISSAKEYFRNNDWYRNLSTSDKQKANAAFRKHVEPAVNEAAATATQEEPTPDGERKVLKTFEGRRFYGGSFREEVKEEVKKAGLYRTIESQVEARERAVKFIEAVGIDAAVEAVRNNDMEGGAAAFVWDEALRMLDQQILESEDVAISEELVAKQAEMVQEIGKMQLAAGRFNAAWGKIIKSSDLGYHSEKKAKEWEEQFGERPSEEVMEAWRKRDEELARLKKLIEAAEKRAEDAEAKLAVDGIAESVSRENEQRKTGRYSQRAKRMADQLRTLKAKPIVFLDADGNPIEITKLGSVIPIDINAIIEAGARAIEKTGQIADAIAAMSEMLSKEKWFSSLDDRNKMAVLRQLEDQAKATFDSFGNERVKVPIAMIRSAVGAGIRDIDSLVNVIKEQLSEQHPDASDREIRDAITGYGKVVNMSKDEISVEVRRLKDIGRVISALEDAENKIRPMRSGLQRDKLDADQRALRNKLRDALRDLPLDQAENDRLLKTALEAAKTRARNRIEDIQRQIDNKERETRKRTVLEPDNELKALLKEKELLEQEMERVFGPRVISEETRVQTALSSIRRSIEEYERRIAANDLDPKKQPRSLESPELKIARENLDKVRDDYKRLQDEAGVVDRRRTEAAKKATKARIAELEERIKNQDFSKKPVRKTIADDELTALRAEKERIKEEYDTDFYREMLRNRSWGQVAGDRAWQAWDLLRMVQATFDLSFILIQGGNMTISNMWRRPDVVASAFRNMSKAFKSEKYSEQFIRDIKAQPWYQQAKEAGLAITHPHAELSAREELFMSDWTRIFWSGLGSPLLVIDDKLHEGWMKANPVRALERAGGAYLNTIRIERYLEGVEMLEKKKADINGKEVTAKDYKDVANAVNTLTGRASLGKAEGISSGLTKIFFSPRMWASAIKTATPYGLVYFSRLSPTARKMALLDMARYVGTTASIVGLVAYALANDDDDETYVETDMRSSDFGKIRLGDMRIDPWGGKVQQVVASVRLGIGAISLFMDEPLDAYKRTDGRISPLGKSGAPTMFDVGLNMALNKLSPSASFLAQATRTTINKYGERRAPFEDEPYEIGAAFKEKLVPIYFSTVGDLMADDPGALEGFLLFYSFFGAGVQYYGERGAKLDQSIPAPAFTGRRIERPQ